MVPAAFALIWTLACDVSDAPPRLGAEDGGVFGDFRALQDEVCVDALDPDAPACDEQSYTVRQTYTKSLRLAACVGPDPTVEEICAATAWSDVADTCEEAACPGAASQCVGDPSQAQSGAPNCTPWAGSDICLCTRVVRCGCMCEGCDPDGSSVSPEDLP